MAYWGVRANEPVGCDGLGRNENEPGGGCGRGSGWDGFLESLVVLLVEDTFEHFLDGIQSEWF
jgi:hypothetical protein